MKNGVVGVVEPVVGSSKIEHTVIPSWRPSLRIWRLKMVGELGTGGNSFFSDVATNKAPRLL